MKNRLMILDQNKLREKAAPEVAEYLKNSPNVHFVLPEIAFIEMTKNENFREDTLRGSLRMLSGYPSRTHVSKSLAQCFEEEFKTLTPASKHMTLREHRKSLRSLLGAINGDDEGVEGLNRIISDTNGIHDSLSQYYLDHDENKKRLGETINEARETLGDGLVKDLRANRVSREQRLDLIYRKGNLNLARILYRRSIPENKALLFARKKPMLLRESYSVWWLALDWVSAGGFESAKPEKITNDLIDQEYAITATCFDGIISAEKRVVCAYEDLKVLLNRPVFQY